MTDVSNLDDLANAIASSSPAIKAYAVAQAAATQSQELDIQSALWTPGPQGAQGATGPPGPMGEQGEPGTPGGGSGSSLPTVFNLDDPAHGVIGNGTTDDSAAIQAVINSLPATGAVIQCARRYRCVTGLNLSGKSSVRFVGLTGRSYNDTQGAQFISGTAGMTLFTKAGGIDHRGPVFEWTNFYDPVGGCTLLSLTNTTFWATRYCGFFGFGLANPSTAINASGVGGDNAWWSVDECIFRSFGHTTYQAGKGALVCNTLNQGGTVKGGAFLGCYPGIDVFQNVEGVRVFGVKFDGGQPAIRLGGVRAKIWGCNFESAENNAIGIQVVAGASSNHIAAWSCHDGLNRTGDVGLQIDAGSNGTQVMGASFVNIQTPWVNNSASSVLVGPAFSPTITGSRGGNAALADLLSKLAGQGLIINNTSA